MKKLLLSTCLAVSMLCSTAACNSVETPAEQSVSQTAAKPDLGIMPLTLSYGQEIYSSSGEYTTGDYTATKNNGNIIRVYYRNDADEGAYVTLWKNGLLGESDVLHFTVNSKKQAFEEYSGLFSDSGTYHVRVTPVSGRIVDGYLAFVQTSTSLKS